MAKLSTEPMDFSELPDFAECSLYLNGQMLLEDKHFQDHIDHGVPIQIYWGAEHAEIGFVECYCADYVTVNQVLYNRRQFIFISRPGY